MVMSMCKAQKKEEECIHYFCCWGRTLTTHLHLVVRLRLSGAPPLPPSICLQGLHRDNFTFTTVLSLPALTIQHLTSSF